jgi:hypothetical protein
MDSCCNTQQIASNLNANSNRLEEDAMLKSILNDDDEDSSNSSKSLNNHHYVNDDESKYDYSLRSGLFFLNHVTHIFLYRNYLLKIVEKPFNDENVMMSSLSNEHAANRSTSSESKHKEERRDNAAFFLEMRPSGAEGVSGARQVHHYVSPNSSKTFQNFFQSTSILNLSSNQKPQGQHSSSSMNRVDECEEPKSVQTSKMTLKDKDETDSKTTQKPLVRRRSIENIAESVSLQHSNLVSQENGN